MSIKTNIIRIQMQGNCYCYQAHFKSQITQQDALEIQTYLQSEDNNLIYAHPYLYANLPINKTQFQIILSKGQAAFLSFQFIKQRNKYQILDQICQKILRSFQFLPYRKIKTYFNPFQQKDNHIPGIYLQAVQEQTYKGIAFLPINLQLQPPIQISSTKILLNYSNGRFYQPNEAVKVDKQNNLLHFRNGQKVIISNLRKCKIKDLSGWSLAERLSNYYERIKDNCKIFFQNWNVKLQASFFRMNGTLIAPGPIQFRQRIDKSLNQIIYPMARNTYNHSFRELFKTSTFQAILQAQFVIIAPQQYHKNAKHILYEFQKLIQRMGLKIKISLVMVNTLGQRNQVIQMINNIFMNKLAIYVLVVPSQPTSSQAQNIQFFKQQMINREFYYHLLTLNPQEEAEQLDIVAIRNLAIIYCKMRINPWKIKNLPFTNKPAAVCNIDVQQTSEGKYSIALVLTMNLYFSKFCCIHTLCNPDRMEQTIYTVLQQSLNKFFSVHNTYPSRIFVFRTGIMSDVHQEYKLVNNRINNYFLNLNNKMSSILTYIQLRKKHPFRTFVQSDQNYISKHTVKKTQLLASTVINKRYYIQLQFDEAPLELQIFEIENDPSFVQNILLLTVKLCYGSVGNRFGKGLGFLQYASKLNNYKEFNLAKWQKLLLEGVMLFL